mmetsp:Transcript_32586/g.97395  ORF Transcript_32586/g.97395 Transcript_32586/m.97395 type:complete len:125 (-) Transcript_32586:643-1017(-)
MIINILALEKRERDGKDELYATQLQLQINEVLQRQAAEAMKMVTIDEGSSPTAPPRTKPPLRSRRRRTAALSKRRSRSSPPAVPSFKRPQRGMPGSPLAELLPGRYFSASAPRLERPWVPQRVA